MTNTTMAQAVAQAPAQAAVQAVADDQFAAATAPGTGLVAVDFWAEWCGPCRMMTPVVEAAAHEIPGIRFLQMDTDANPATMVRLGVRSLPTTVLFKDGEVVDRIVGATTGKAFRARLEKHL